jgi:signal transduction histidine kinase
MTYTYGMKFDCKRPIYEWAFIGFLFIFLGSFAQAKQLENGSAQQAKFNVEYCQSDSQINEIEEAVQCKYLTHFSPLNSGLKGSVRWIRIQVEKPNSPNLETSVAIRVSPHLLKEIEFFQYENSHWVGKKAGSQVSKDDAFNDVGGYLFIAPLGPNNLSAYYVKVNAATLNHIWIDVKSWPNSDGNISANLLGIGAQIGILIAILFFALVSAVLNPSALMARFCVSILNLLVCVLAGSGILAIYVFRQNLLLDHLTYNWSLCLRVGLWIWVSQAFLTGLQTPKWYRPSCWAVYILTGLCLAMIALGNTNNSIQIMLVVAISAPILQIIAITKTPDIAKSLRIALISGFSLLIFLILISALSVLVPSQNNSELPLYLSRLMDFVNPLVMLSIIVYQGRLARKEFALAKTALAEAHLQAQYEHKLVKDKGTLIDMLAHEVKNSLAYIGLAVNTIKNSLKPALAKDQQRLANIHQSIENIDAVLEHCSLMNSIDQNSLLLALQEVDLKKAIEDSVDALNANLTIHCEVDGSPALNTDPYLLGNILKNLLENAIKYSPKDSAISIKSEQGHSQNTPTVRITISNFVDKTLVPDETLIFQRFYRHPSALSMRGSGLGLSICQELAHMLGGKIAYAHLKDQVHFTVELPA